MNWNRDGKKKEIWETDKSKLSVYWIHTKVWFRKFQRETKGLGILMLIFIAAMVIMNVLAPFISIWAGDSFKSEQERRIERQAYCFKYGCLDGV